MEHPIHQFHLEVASTVLSMLTCAIPMMSHNEGVTCRYGYTLVFGFSLLNSRTLTVDAPFRDGGCIGWSTPSVSSQGGISGTLLPVYADVRPFQ